MYAGNDTAHFSARGFYGGDLVDLLDLPWHVLQNLRDDREAITWTMI